jgi:hypothetical protein
MDLDDLLEDAIGDS